jgi:membrane-associated phospholipid phosphatase
MKELFSSLPRHFLRCFSGRMIGWHLLAIGLTLVLVASGLDWFYFKSTRNPTLRAWMFTAAPVGGLVPLLLPVALLLLGWVGGRARLIRLGWAIGQSEILGSLISSTYKAFTGRAHPSFGTGADLTHVFQFGFLRGGVFWGWPSSHTTIAFAMATTVFTFCSRQCWVGYVALAYAFYIGLGVSMTIHWFSDFVAGAIIGSVIGVVVGRGFAMNAPVAGTGRGSAPRETAVST